MHISNELRLWMNVVGNRFFAVQIFIWRGTHNVFLHFWSNVLYCILESFCDFQSRHGSHATLNGTRMENLCGKSLRKLPRKHIGWIKKRNDIVISSVNREENLYSNRLFERFEIIWAYISIYVKGFYWKPETLPTTMYAHRWWMKPYTTAKRKRIYFTVCALRAFIFKLRMSNEIWMWKGFSTVHVTAK